MSAPDKAIVAIGHRPISEVIADAFAAVGKAGVVVLLSMGGGFHDPHHPAASPGRHALEEDGQGQPVRRLQPDHRHPPPRSGCTATGDLKLDELITRRYTLEQVNEGYEDLLAGHNIRGVITHSHHDYSSRVGAEY